MCSVKSSMRTFWVFLRHCFLFIRYFLHFWSLVVSKIFLYRSPLSKCHSLTD